MVFSEVCHSCGLCQMVCPQGAVAEEEKAVGVLEIGRHGETKVVSGILNLGEASGVPVIRAALKQAEKLTFLDCPPGSACSVMESIMDADYCVLVTEPKAFGFHNFQIVHQLASLLKKPCGVVINKQLSPYEPLERFCEEHHLPVLERIPYLEIGRSGSVQVVTGVLNPGEASGIPVIRAALARARGLTVIDCPPGSACSVMESIMDADYCVLVTEPTAFGFHNFQMVHQLASLLKKPCGVVINKQLSPYEPLERFCEEHHLPVLERIPYNEELARRIAQNEVVAETVPEEKRRFRALLDRIGGAV